MRKITVDTSAIMSGEVGRMIRSGELAECGIIIPTVIIDELHAVSASGDARAQRALDEIARLHKDAADARVSVRVSGDGAPRNFDPHKMGHVVASIIRNTAHENGASLCTADNVHALAAESAGISVMRCAKQDGEGEPWFMKYFDETTMSVHLKEGMRPMVKRGTPESVLFTSVDDTELTAEQMSGALSIIEGMQRSGHAADISLPGALVIQYGTYRIAATYRPFSEAQEITIVHPTVSMSLEDYDMSDKLRERLTQSSAGILISGSPGSGKSTFASALANHYHRASKTVKTFESPRDLQLDVGITQYSRLDGDFANSADILLLVRPDYTIFDEVRRREDFEVFSDLRLSGVGMVGVVHASSTLDAIQRFIGKIELGIIPHVLDTVIFVSRGKVETVYSVSMRVKVPSGMTEQDLARPVIEITDFDRDELVYEVYAFGEENMIVPVSERAESSGVDHLAQQHIREVMQRFDHDPNVEILNPGSVRVGVSKGNIATIIGRGGTNISALERELRVHIDVVEKGAQKQGSISEAAADVDFDVSESRAFLTIGVDRRYAGMHAEIYSSGDVITSARVDRKGRIKLDSESSEAHEAAQALSKKTLSVSVSNS